VLVRAKPRVAAEPRPEPESQGLFGWLRSKMGGE
jgi:hypothetical protein